MYIALWLHAITDLGKKLSIDDKAEISSQIDWHTAEAKKAQPSFE
jgi:hypothetical protein